MNDGVSIAGNVKKNFGVVFLLNGNCQRSASNHLFALRLSDNPWFIPAMVCVVVVANSNQADGIKILWYYLLCSLLALEADCALGFFKTSGEQNEFFSLTGEGDDEIIAAINNLEFFCDLI